MNAVTKAEPQQKLMLLEYMADKYGLRPQEFADTVRKTCGLATASPEEFAAFIMVAREYDLNPLLREIFAFPKRGGGIVPIVSIDGWVNLVNSHPACDGFEFDVEHGENSDLVAITCRMYRKDRNRPVVVTEYYDECKRDTEPWKMKHRMLRHKAMIQAARYAFGFSGIYDEDEGAKIAEMKDVTPPQPPAPPKPPVPPAPQSEAKPEVEDAEIITEDPVADGIDADEHDPEPGEILGTSADRTEFNPTAFFEEMETSFAAETTVEGVEERWNEFDPMAQFDGDDTNQGIAKAIKNQRLQEIKRANGNG